MKVARQFIAWNRFNREIRPVGHGLILTQGLIRRPDRSAPIGPNNTVPYGTVPVLHGFQAINCLATFIQSLRDKVQTGPKLLHLHIF